jgi:co-chaperonin GroES (HSP10)
VKYRIFGDRMLVKVLETHERTRGGLHIPDLVTDNTPWMKAEVLEKGTGMISAGVLFPLPVEVGEVVVFFRSMQPGDQLVVPLDDGEEGLVIRFASCLGALEGLAAASSLVGTDGRPVVVQ